jgi:tRNA threonylcarbamoyladenosine biosynthesis protein TsaE
VEPNLEHSFHSGSAEETLALGAKLGKLLQPGDFVGLIGDLGAGKTQLVRGVASGADVPAAQVASPSFAIVYPYAGRLPIYHADFYRLESYDELYATGFTDLVAGDGAVLVEWLDRIPRATPPELLMMRFRIPDAKRPEVRTISAQAFGPRHTTLLRDWIFAQKIR